MEKLFSKHVHLLAIAAMFFFGFTANSDLIAQNNQQIQNPKQIFSLLTGTAHRAPDGYVYLGDKIYLCQNNVLTQAYESVNIGKTICLKADGTYTKDGVTTAMLRGTYVKPNGELIK